MVEAAGDATGIEKGSTRPSNRLISLNQPQRLSFAFVQRFRIKIKLRFQVNRCKQPPHDSIRINPHIVNYFT